MAKVQLYKKIEDEITSRIRSEIYPPGFQLPVESELCQEFGASRLTVAKGLSALISSGLIERIRGKGSFVRKDLHAIPAAARSFSGGLFTFISPLPGEHEAAMKPGVLEGMHAAAKESEFNIGVEFYSTAEEELHILRTHTRSIIKGFVIWPTQDERIRQELNLLQSRKFPYVLVDTYFPGDECDYVISDKANAAEMVIAHLYELGHRHIAYLTLQPDRMTIAEGLAGVCGALSRRDLPFLTNIGVIHSDNQVNTQLHAAHDRGAISAWLREQLGRPEAPTAIFCSNDALALAVTALLAEWGVKVPEAISVAGIDNTEQAVLAPIPLTTVAQNCFEMGFRAVQTLLNRLKNPETALLPRQYRLPPTLIVRESTGPACR